MKRPVVGDTAPYYFLYIDKVPDGDILELLHEQLDPTVRLLRSVKDPDHRYAPDKWSIREVLSHLNDAERLFEHRAFWIARGFNEPLPSFDQNVALSGARPDRISWQEHIDEFIAVRRSSLALFRHLPDEAWSSSGIASGFPFTVLSLAYMCYGHVEHHLRLLRERYGVA